MQSAWLLIRARETKAAVGVGLISVFDLKTVPGEMFPPGLQERKTLTRERPWAPRESLDSHWMRK